jgi:hypothetical protein
MAIYTHVISAAVAHARAAGDGDPEARRLLERATILLAHLGKARGPRRAALARELKTCEADLAAHFSRSGRDGLATQLEPITTAVDE